MAAKTLAVILIGEQVSWQIQFLIHDDWNRFDSLPFDLCDFTCFVAALACWTQLPLLVELTWFWALAGTSPGDHHARPVHAVPAPVLRQLRGRTPGHRRRALVSGHRAPHLPPPWGGQTSLPYQHRVRRPVRHSRRCDRRRLSLPAPSPAVVQPPQRARPWPWYIVSSAAIALVLFVLLDLPFRSHHPSDARPIHS